MPGFTFPKVGPLGLGSPPSRTGNQFVGTMFRYDCQQPFSGSFAFARPPIPCILLFGSCPVFFFGSPGGLEYPCQRLGSCLSSVPLLLTYGKETVGSPKFPRCPREHMPRPQTPVVSYTLALSCLGLLPSGRWTPSAFPLLLRLKRLSHRPRLYTFRGSITRPAPLFPSASYSRYRVCT
jgi:hypothetical protein